MGSLDSLWLLLQELQELLQELQGEAGQ